MVDQSVSEAVSLVLQEKMQALYGNLQPGLHFQAAGEDGRSKC
jgi:hypothetical protein